MHLDDILADAQRRHGAAAERKGLRLRCRSNAYRIDGSELILARILDNLIVNAIRYTAHGHILLGVRRRRDGLEIQVLEPGRVSTPPGGTNGWRPSSRAEAWQRNDWATAWACISYRLCARKPVTGWSSARGRADGWGKALAQLFAVHHSAWYLETTEEDEAWKTMLLDLIA